MRSRSSFTGELDNDPPLAASDRDADPSLERIGEPLGDPRRPVPTAHAGSEAFATDAPHGHNLFDGSDAEPFRHDALGEPLDGHGVVQAEQSPGVAG